MARCYRSNRVHRDRCRCTSDRDASPGFPREKLGRDATPGPGSGLDPAPAASADSRLPGPEAFRRLSCEEHGSRKRKNADGMLIYGPIPESRYDDVIRHLRNSFPDEPLNVSVGLCQHGQPCEVLENHNLETMKDGLSLMVTDKETGVIAGVVLNGISWKGDPEKYLEELKSVPNLQYQRIFGLLNSVNKEADLFTKYNVDKVFDVRILSVDEKFRGKGIAKELFKRSEVVAQQNGFKIMKTDATSLFTQRVAESCGYFTEKSVKYHDYKDEKGKKIYDTISPHDFYKIMVKIVPTNPTG